MITLVSRTLLRRIIPVTRTRLVSSSVDKMALVTQVQTPESTKQSLRQHSELIFRQGMEAVLPGEMISEHIRIHEDQLVTDFARYELSQNVHVVGFGKAVLGMAHHLDQILGEHIKRGVISVPMGIRENYIRYKKQDLLLRPESRIGMYEGAANNLPDDGAYYSAMMIKKIVTGLTADDLLIVLISGGGSALLSAPEPPLTIEDVTKVTKLLSEHGATIQELNTVRKNIDELKGGDLARLAYPAKVLSLILSDVIGDPLDLIASAPTVPDKSTAEQCLGYFRKLKVEHEIPTSVMEFLRNKQTEEHHKQADYMPRLDPRESFEHVQNLLVGSNFIALKQSIKTARGLGYVVYSLTRSMTGEARLVAKTIARLANYICLVHGYKEHREQSNPTVVAAEMELIRYGITKTKINEMIHATNRASNIGQDICIIAGGETTVEVKGKGKGGRCQELGLAFAIEIQKLMAPSVRDRYDVEFLAAGTDGQDAATDAAGAFADLGTMERAKQKKLNAQDYLEKNDSYTFYDALGEHLKTGLTGTNVMDICVLLIRPKS